MSLFEKRISLDIQQPIPLTTGEPLHALQNIRPVPNSFFSPRLIRPYDWERDDSGLQEDETITDLGGTALSAVEILDAKINQNKTIVNELQHLE